MMERKRRPTRSYIRISANIQKRYIMTVILMGERYVVVLFLGFHTAGKKDPTFARSPAARPPAEGSTDENTAYYCISTRDTCITYIVAMFMVFLNPGIEFFSIGYRVSDVAWHTVHLLEEYKYKYRRRVLLTHGRSCPGCSASRLQYGTCSLRWVESSPFFSPCSLLSVER